MPELRGRQTVNTFSILYYGARFSLKTAEENEEGSFYALLSCLVMAAFTVEAYLNHLVMVKFEGEFKGKKRPSVWEKYKRLRVLCGLSSVGIPDAYPSVEKLLSFRNDMAHAKTEINSVSEEIDEMKISAALIRVKGGWRDSVTVEHARESLSGVKLLIEELHFHAGLGKFPLRATVHGMYSLSTSTGEEPTHES